MSQTPADPSRWTQAILKLTKLTRDGRITWARGTPRLRGILDSMTTGPEDVYEARHDTQRLRFRRWINVRGPVLGLGFGSPFQYALEMIDDAGETIWTFPAVSDLGDLYQAIRYFEAGVGPYIDRLLAEP